MNQKHDLDKVSNIFTLKSKTYNIYYNAEVMMMFGTIFQSTIDGFPKIWGFISRIFIHTTYNGDEKRRVNSVQLKSDKIYIRKYTHYINII